MHARLERSLPRPIPSATSGADRTALHVRLIALWRTWQRRSRQRRELRELDDAVLRELGITRAQASFDGDRPFWRE